MRNATISGSTLAIRGDLNGSTTLTVIAPPEFSKVTWNGMPVSANIRASRSLTSVGGFVGQLKMSVSLGSVEVPKLQNWKFANSLPEVQSDFSDEAWTIANRTATNIPFPKCTTVMVEYYMVVIMDCKCRKFEHTVDSNNENISCENIVLRRGHFSATGQEKTVNLTINGGEGAAYRLER